MIGSVASNGLYVRVRLSNFAKVLSRPDERVTKKVPPNKPTYPTTPALLPPESSALRSGKTKGILIAPNLLYLGT